MKKFKFIKISNTKKLRYIDNYFKKKLYIIFLPGFMSDLEGEKPQTLLNLQKRTNWVFEFRILWAWKVFGCFY